MEDNNNNNIIEYNNESIQRKEMNNLNNNNSNNIMQKFKSTRILATIGIICVILGILTPYIKYTIWGYSTSQSLWSGGWEGKVSLILIILEFIFIFQDVVERAVPAMFNNEVGKKLKENDNPRISLIPTAIIAALILFGTSGISFDAFQFYSIGFYATWIGIASLIAYAFLYRKK